MENQEELHLEGRFRIELRFTKASGNFNILGICFDTQDKTQTLVKSLDLIGNSLNDVHAAKRFAESLGDVLMHKFEPSLMCAYKKKEGADVCVIDDKENAVRKAKWEEKFKELNVG